MNIKFKRLVKEAVAPKYAHTTDAAMDLTATSIQWDTDNNIITYGTGLAFELPKGHVGLLFMRSSSYKTNLLLTNAVGVLDENYRGEVMFKFKYTSVRDSKPYHIGDRIGQLMVIPIPKMEMQEVLELESSDRGTGGHGSSGGIHGS